jgi:hypothetical protein
VLTKGVYPKIVGEMLGHDSVSITLDVYSHVIPRPRTAAPLALEDALGDPLGVGGVGGEAATLRSVPLFGVLTFPTRNIRLLST